MDKPQPVYEAWFRPMGLRLHLVTNSPAIVAAAESSFGGYGPAGPEGSADLAFHLFEHAVDDGRPGRPVFRTAGSLIYQTAGRDSTLAADLAGGFAFGYFSATVLANPAFFRWHFLELAFFQMLEARGWMGVHAAAVARNGRAALLRATSGGGKTTLAYAAARRRCQALAEDVVWLEPGGRRWWGMPWSFHLLPDARNLFPELTACEPVLQTSGELKLEVNPEKVRPGSTTPWASPAAVVLVERRPGELSRLEPIDAGTARAGWPAALTGQEMQRAHHPAQLEALLRHKTYRLYYGDDIEATLSLLESLLTETAPETDSEGAGLKR